MGSDYRINQIAEIRYLRDMLAMSIRDAETRKQFGFMADRQIEDLPSDLPDAPIKAAFESLQGKPFSDYGETVLPIWSGLIYHLHGLEYPGSRGRLSDRPYYGPDCAHPHVRNNLKSRKVNRCSTRTE